jgi:hypothetical protein
MQTHITTASKIAFAGTPLPRRPLCWPLGGVRTFPPKGSPELEQRLRDQFPPGSDDARLIAALTSRGFKMDAPCKNDSTVQRASFYQKRTGIITTYAGAVVYWKIDDQHRIVWTKGYVSYGGL